MTPMRARGARQIGLLSATAAALLLAVAGTFSAWTQSSDSSENVIESASSYPPPTLDTPPQISGVERDGETLTATEGEWSGPGTSFGYEHQWLRCNISGGDCVDVAGADGQSYALTPADVPSAGRTIRVRVTATSLYGQTTALSAQTGTIQARLPVNQSPPTIAGPPREGQEITVEPGSWEGTPPIEHYYLWHRCDADGENCEDIETDGEPTYVVTDADLGSTFRATVIADNTVLPGGGQSSATSEPTEAAAPIDNVPDNDYATNGMVTTITRHGGNTYIAGSFSLIGKPTGSFGEVAADTGTAEISFPATTGGNVTTFEPDGAGGWYIGGSFTKVGAQPRAGLAHILPNGTLDPTWDPQANGPVMEIRPVGGTVFVGGMFTTLDGLPRARLGAVAAATGNVTAWTANTDGTVFSIVPNGSTLHVGGSFTTIGGSARSNLAEVSAATGAATSFNPSPNGWVSTIVRSGTTLYAAGNFTAFTNAGGLARSRAAAIDLTTGQLTSWNPTFDDLVRELLLDGSRIYASGEFTTAGGVSHPRLVGVSATTGAVTWNPPDPAGTFTTGGGVWALDLEGTTLYAGGDFTSVGGESRRGLAAFDTSTAALTAWAPQASAGVHHLQHVDGKVLVGGDPGFDPLLLNTLERTNAAAFDGEGEPTGWNPAPSGVPYAMTAISNAIIIGGDFATIGGQARANLAAVHPDTGTAVAWSPNPNAQVRTLAATAENLYVGGDFTTVEGQARNRLAAFSATGVLTSWAPSANSFVNELSVADTGDVYIGGWFTSVEGTPRNYAASITAAGTLGPWNPAPNAFVDAVYASPDGGPIYLGGAFSTLAGVPRANLAATTASGALTPWNAAANGTVSEIEGRGEKIWVGGLFSSIGGQPRQSLAALRTSDATATPWAPNPDGFMISLLSDGSGVHVGGLFRMVGDAAPYGYAHFR